MKKSLQVLIGAISLLSAFSSFAAQYTINCPKLKDNHDNTLITFYSGHPKHLVSLVPDSENTVTHTRVWTFKKQDNIWLICHQGNKDSGVFKLPPVTRCQVTYENGNVISSTCQS